MKERWQTEPVSEEEDAAITAAALSDPDNPPLTEEQMSRMRPARDVVPREMYESLTDTKAVFVDRAVVEHFRETAGPDWDARINEVLREAAGLKAAAE